MKSIFESTGFSWVKYSEYDLVTADDGQQYVTPAKNSKLTPYDPMADVEPMTVDALNVGLLSLGRKGKKKIQTAIMEFVSKYGLLGFMTALPTTPDFIQFDTAYIPHNHFIKVEFMPSKEYYMLFFPFEKPDLIIGKDEFGLNISDNNELVALTAVSGRLPLALSMSYLREYAEPYEWLEKQFKDFAFSLYTSFIYYDEYDDLDEDTRRSYRFGMAAFGGIAPNYRILLKDKPTIVWEFYSLLRSLQLMISFMITDDKRPLRVCKHCEKAFVAGHVNAVFCSPKCKNQYNVYKNREKKKDE